MSKEKFISACPLDCFDVCSLSVTVEDGRVVDIEGNKEHPVTKGYICEKGRKHLERLYSPQRLRHPLKKQDGEWVRISWEEAFQLMTDRIDLYTKEFGSHSIASYSDGGASGQLKNVEDLFFEQLGSTAFTGTLCLGAGKAAQLEDFGDVLSHSHKDMLNSKLIIIWGRNPAETNMHFMEHLKRAKDNGAKVILVDPVKTETAKHCDWHIRLKPDSDCAFTLAAAKYIIDKNKYDHDFVTACANGFEELAAFAAKLDINTLLDICGIEMNELVQFTDSLASIKPAAIHMGYGLQRYNFGGLTVRSIDMLAAITGNIGVPGGGANYLNRVSAGLVDWNVMDGSGNSMRFLSKPKFSQDVKAAANPSIKAIFISRANPVLQLPDTNGVLEALENIEFKVVLDHFMTDTAEKADLVLPVTYFLEEEDFICSSMWNPYINYNKKCIERFHEAKPEFEIYTELAKRLGMKGFPELREEEWLKTILKPLEKAGVNLEELKGKGYMLSPGFMEIPWKDNVFETESGRFEFLKPEKIEEYLESKRKTSEYAYQLLSAHNKKSLHSQHNMGSAEKMPIVYMDIEDAEALSIKEGTVAVLYNENGELKVKVSISDSCQRGMLYIKEGWWLKNGGSINRLTASGVSDIGEQAVFNECRCNIRIQNEKEQA